MRENDRLHWVRVIVLLGSAACELTPEASLARRGLALQATDRIETAAEGDGSDAGRDEDAGSAADLLDQLRALPGVADVGETPTSVPGARAFSFTLALPIDHTRPETGTFSLRMQLLHRGYDAPTVLSSSGYRLFGVTPFDNELSYVLSGNIVAVEHRFFGPSTPLRKGDAEPPVEAWQYLTITQAAADNHRVVEVLRGLYPGAWLSTGASKGGMTSVYHRRFYPDDLQGTVAYVAPHSEGTDDPRYSAFLEQVGDASCRQRIVALQRDLLTRREEVLPELERRAAARGWTFEHIGFETAFEHIVIEYRWAFWQYGYAADCDAIPEPGSDVNVLLDAVADVLPLDLASDQSTLSVDGFAAYFYQSATQLGAYLPPEQHLSDLLKFPGTDTAQAYAPLPNLVFDPAPMRDVGAWVRDEAEHVILVYGENDPWTAGELAIGEGRDVHKYIVPGGNHGAGLLDTTLPDDDRAEAFGVLQAWTGVTPREPTAAVVTALRARRVEESQLRDRTRARQ